MPAGAESRRRFLTRLCGCAATGLGLISAGCGSGLDREAILARARELDQELRCTETNGLWPAEIETRKTNRYVDRSTVSLHYCFNCSNFVEPPEPGRCGTCRTVKGPIHPGGWCESWTEKR